MHISLGKILGIRLGETVIKALACTVLTNLVSVVGVNLSASAALSFIPGLGSISAGLIAAAVDFCYVYIAGIVYIKLIAKLLEKNKKFECMTEEELKKAAKEAGKSVNMKKAFRETKEVFKKSKEEIINKAKSS